jgi:DNA-binding IscR family transcriptional regulator
MTNQYAIAVHILTLVDYSTDPVGSEGIAESVGVNPVIIRNIIGLLRRGGLLETQRGVAGARLTRPADRISLLDVYRAVNAPESVLKIHQKPNPTCPLGANIQSVLDEVFTQAQLALESKLALLNLTDIANALQSRIV